MRAARRGDKTRAPIDEHVLVRDDFSLTERGPAMFGSVRLGTERVDG